jgi:hypothetical protein
LRSLRSTRPHATQKSLPDELLNGGHFGLQLGALPVQRGIRTGFNFMLLYPLSVLSGIEPAELTRAIRSSDLARLTRIPGVGKKTAERIVLELKDRLPDAGLAEPAPSRPGDDVRDDLLSALTNLGYQQSSIEKTVDKVLGATEDRAFEPLLRTTLKLLMAR